MSSIELPDFISFFLYSCILYFLSEMSKRLGEVMGMKKYYYLYYIGIFFMLVASITMVLSLGGHEVLELFVYGYVFFSLGLTMGLIASIKYWGWLIKELIEK